jgi:hypothetical protein
MSYCCVVPSTSWDEDGLAAAAILLDPSFLQIVAPLTAFFLYAMTGLIKHRARVFGHVFQDTA